MDPETLKYFEITKAALDVEQKYGPIGRLAAKFFRRQPNSPPVERVDYREELVNAALENAVETVRSKDITIAQAIQLVDRVVTFDDFKILNSTWQSHWSEGASKVGIDDEERRIWWARLLAGEIQQPGSFSLRTMAVMDTLSTREARLFAKLCDYVWNQTNPCLISPIDGSIEWKPDFAEAALLESIGLVKFNSLSGFNVSARNEAESMWMMFHDKVFQITAPESKSAKLRCGPLLLTDIGQEMYRLTAPNFSETYLNEILEEWKQSFTVREVNLPPDQDEYKY